MSHFVHSRGDRDYEELTNQLLRREPLDHDESQHSEEAPIETKSGQQSDPPSPVTPSAPSGNPSQPSASATGLPSSLAVRLRPDLRPDLSRPGSPSNLRSSSPLRPPAQGARNSSYSRTNSPERSERARSPALGGGRASRPHSLAHSINEELHRPPGSERQLSDAESSAAEGSSNRSSSTSKDRRERIPYRPSRTASYQDKDVSRKQRPLKNVAFTHRSPQRRGADAGEYAYQSDQQGGPTFTDSWADSRVPVLHSRRHHDQQEGPKKLGTWDGVFVPVSLSILGVILFLRFGFIIGQAGLLGALALLVVSYMIDTLTSLSISAICTNGVVRAGGIFYLASRSLGPEFGGATGLLFWLGQLLNASLNALGFVETLIDAFGESRRSEYGQNGLPEGPWWNFAYGSFVLLLSTVICLVGSKLFFKATMVLAVVLGTSILSIPISSLIVTPFSDAERGIFYTGWSLETLRSNLFPHFTSGAAGSGNGAIKEGWSSVFGVLFPAVTGVLAGASMSGDLRKPSKSIPKGTNWSLLVTFVIYTSAFVILAGTCSRASFYLDIGIMADISAMPSLITVGALASMAFSALLGVQACGKVLQAISRDHLLPILDVFAQGTEVADTPTYGIVATYVCCQLVLFVDSVNMIAQLVTMTSLLCFAVLSFACLALKAGGAPSFRPSFPYFNIYTAGLGAFASLFAMFFADGTAASGCIFLAIILFVAIHVFSPPKPWGDVTRNIHYWLTRKYLLRLDERKTNLKHWRPQVLLLANNPRSEWNLIIFCNSLKKGGLYILGHCIKGGFTDCLAELRKQQMAWLKLVDLSGIKSFVDVVIANDEREGARSLILSAGLGGMRPNIVVLGFPRELQAQVKAQKGRSSSISQSLSNSQQSKSNDGSDITVRGPHAMPAAGRARDGRIVEHLPTDTTRRESPITAEAYVGIIEDALALNKAVAIAYGFDAMQLPGPSAKAHYEKTSEKQFIDLWPIQIASPDSEPEHAWDTYTMVLQLGTILSLTGTWKQHQLRVSVFVEDPSEIEEERIRVRSLLDNLRIPASLRIFCLSDGSVASYEAIVHGKTPIPSLIEESLKGDPWWMTLKELRKEDELRAKATAAKRRSELLKEQKQQGVPISNSSSASASPNPAADERKRRRDQKTLGYSLPPEHLEYFQRNIRIGLSHPRARARLDSDVDDDDSDSDSDGSGLSDELLHLGEDEFFGAGTSGFGRSKTHSPTSQHWSRTNHSVHGRSRSHSIGGQGSGGLPDEPTRKPLKDAQTPSTSYGSMSATPIVRPDGTITNYRGSDWEMNRREGSEDTVRANPALNRSASQRTVRMGSETDRGLASSSSSISEESSGGSGSESEDLRSHPHHSRSYSDYHLPGISRASFKHPTPSPSPRGELPIRPTLPHLTFNTLPNKAQFLILNELFRAHSSSSATSVILTSLPAPEPGTALKEEGVRRYLGQLEVLCTGEVPLLAIHARELTLSMSL